MLTHNVCLLFLPDEAKGLSLPKHTHLITASGNFQRVRVWQPLQYLRTEARISVCDIAKCFTSGSHRVSCWTDAISVIVRVDSPPQSRRCIIGSRVYSAHQCFSCWDGRHVCGSVRRAREVPSQLPYCMTARRREVAHSQRQLARNHEKNGQSGWLMECVKIS